MKSESQSQSVINPKVRKGDHVRLFNDNGTLDGVVYTVQGMIRKGRQSLPVIFDYWQPVVLTRYIKVP